jgi:hypothetical protein
VVEEYFYRNMFNPSREMAYIKTASIYNQMIQSLNTLVNSISDRYSQKSNFHKGYPIHTFKSGDGNSQWFFAYIRTQNGDVVVFDMANSNFVTDGRQRSRTFIISERQLRLYIHRRIDEIKNEMGYTTMIK